MAKKSIVTSLRLNEDDYLQLKELKNKYNLSWTKLIAFANELLEKDMKKSGRDNNGNKKDSKPVQKDNH